jgi:hypothetical protein
VWIQALKLRRATSRLFFLPRHSRKKSCSSQNASSGSVKALSQLPATAHPFKGNNGSDLALLLDGGTASVGPHQFKENRMPGIARRSATVFGLLLACQLVVGGCGQFGEPAPRTEDSRFELTHDKQGHLIRLDKATGKVTVIDAPAPRTVTPARQTREKRSAVETPSTTTSSQVTTPSCGNEHITNVRVAKSGAAVFIQPQVLPTPLLTLAIGTELPVMKSAGGWYYVRFEDNRWGSRFGYIHCSSVVSAGPVTHVAASSPVFLTPPKDHTSHSVERAPSLDPPNRHVPAAASPEPRIKTDKLNGYVEWRRPDYLIPPVQGPGVPVRIVDRQTSESDYSYTVPTRIYT